MPPAKKIKRKIFIKKILERMIVLSPVFRKREWWGQVRYLGLVYYWHRKYYIEKIEEITNEKIINLMENIINNLSELIIEVVY